MRYYVYEIIIGVVLVGICVTVLYSVGSQAEKNKQDRRAEIREVCLKNGHTVVESTRDPVCIPAPVK